MSRLAWFLLIVWVLAYTAFMLRQALKWHGKYWNLVRDLQRQAKDAGVLCCSSEGCSATAVESLVLQGQIGHVHDCPQHASDVHQWCAVVSCKPIIDGRCQIVPCTEQPIYTAVPTLKEKS